jgi:hypothetical protein
MMNLEIATISYIVVTTATLFQFKALENIAKEHKTFESIISLKGFHSPLAFIVGTSFVIAVDIIFLVLRKFLFNIFQQGIFNSCLNTCVSKSPKRDSLSITSE